MKGKKKNNPRHWWNWLGLCVCVCVCVRERDGEERANQNLSVCCYHRVPKYYLHVHIHAVLLD